MSDTGSMVGPAAERRHFFRTLVNVCLVLGILFILFSVARGPVYIGIKQARHNAIMQQGRVIGQAMFSYATDNVQNGNAYPDGNSSTEVFQKLLDGHYIDDPAIFYVPLPGKVKAIAGQKLKPENVCWDVTSGVDSRSSDLVPLVFMTGYRITYVPGGSAVPIIKPYPPFDDEPRTWSEWWKGEPRLQPLLPGIAVFYKGNNAVFFKLDISGNPNASISNFISPDFKPDGKTYRQFTPNGPLPGN